jgi:hypothetical protein
MAYLVDTDRGNYIAEVEQFEYSTRNLRPCTAASTRHYFSCALICINYYRIDNEIIIIPMEFISSRYSNKYRYVLRNIHWKMDGKLYVTIEIAAPVTFDVPCTACFDIED